MKANYTIEIQRRNVTPAQLLSYVRRRLKATGGDAFCGCLDLDYFAAGSEPNYDTERDGTHCISHSKPYSMQTYIRQDGRLYNEICEFEFDDEKTGHGYYYLIDAETEADTPDAETAPAAETTETTETTETAPVAEPETETAPTAEAETVETTEDAEADVIIARMAEIIEALPARSAWSRAKKEYAIELLDNLRAAAAYAAGNREPSPLESRETVRAALLNGARDWKEYSYSGCSLIYNGDIAARCCNPSELRRTHGGEKRPNAREDWLDVQARALYQAGAVLMAAYDIAVREGVRV